jgi:hypothetical protein
MRAQRILEIRAVRHVQSHGARVSLAFDPAIASSDVHPGKPRNIACQVGECLIAIGLIGRHPRVDARHDLEQGAHGIDDLALRLGPASCQIDDLAAGQFGVLGAGLFEAAHALEHQRGERQKRDNDQSRANAEDRLVAPRCLARCLGRLCWNVGHRGFPTPGFHKIVEMRKDDLRGAVKI